MDDVMARQLEMALDLLEEDEGLRVGVLTGAGGHFSAGTDLNLSRSPATPRGGEYGIVRRRRTKPVIAAVEGVAFGGGLEIVLACDLIVVASGARLALPESLRGLIPTCGGIFRILDVLPESVALGMLLAGDELGGEQAGVYGLATRVAATGDAIPVALDLAESVCRSSPASLTALLRAVARSREKRDAEGWRATDEAIAAINRGDDMREGVAAFFERRIPSWHPDALKS
ncbi:enoyl-CoA hydratase-related protein [Microbacterium lacus]|uniref:enoyl-CoA hydratase-related protein n=1 Tax=Microbacterium lacus TaxID=415217 RepID=UPI00384F135B